MQGVRESSNSCFPEPTFCRYASRPLERDCKTCSGICFANCVCAAIGIVKIPPTIHGQMQGGAAAATASLSRASGSAFGGACLAGAERLIPTYVHYKRSILMRGGAGVTRVGKNAAVCGYAA
jgi:hypothetical protein